MFLDMGRNTNMSQILVVTGSVRPNSVNEKIVPLVVAELEKQGATITIADLKALDMPFFDGPLTPTSPDFVPPHDSVKEWTRLVDEAEGVVLVTPEYNHTMSPVQLNAIDWIGKEWEDKPVALVGYGWRSGVAFFERPFEWLARFLPDARRDVGRLRAGRLAPAVIDGLPRQRVETGAIQSTLPGQQQEAVMS